MVYLTIRTTITTETIITTTMDTDIMITGSASCPLVQSYVFVVSVVSGLSGWEAYRVIGVTISKRSIDTASVLFLIRLM